MFFQRGVYLLTLFLALFSSIALSRDCKEDKSAEAQPDHAAFQKLLSEVDENSIHQALHRWSSKFQDGIFSKDATAIEAVHSENPRLATKLVHLAKRQRNSTTTTSKETTSKETTSKASETSSAAATSSVAVVTTTNKAGSTVASTVSVESSSGSQASFVQISSTVLSTTTLPNGQQSTITGITVVNAPTTGGSNPTGGSSGTSSGSPSLQSGAASPSGLKAEMIALVGGAVVVAMALQ